MCGYFLSQKNSNKHTVGQPPCQKKAFLMIFPRFFLIFFQLFFKKNVCLYYLFFLYLYIKIKEKDVIKTEKNKKISKNVCLYYLFFLYLYNKSKQSKQIETHKQSLCRFCIA